MVEVFNNLYALDGWAFEKINDAHLVLLPKKQGACEPNEFRPISLVHSLAKIFSKILARRLSPFLPRIIGDNQGALLKGRSLHHNFRMVRDSAKLLKEKKCSSVLLKFNIAKAFDFVAWQFLLEVLESKGFGRKWRAWISMLLGTSSTHILLNGVPDPKIWHGRGLRQGDGALSSPIHSCQGCLGCTFRKSGELPSALVILK